jgi:predicted CXXCH cytochrome family protein
MMEHCSKFISTSNRRLLVLLVVIVVFLGIAVGCSTQARYKFKTVIFTGVPPLHEEQATGEPQPAQDPRTAAAERAAKEQQRRESLLPRYWQHGPFAAGECGRCHSLAQSKSFSGNAAAASGSSSSINTVSASSRLTMPKQQLCTSCHSQHGSDFARAKGLRQHPPSADGLCTGCHSPHQSLRRYMLLKADNVELCSDCHSSDTLTATHTVNPQQDCVECHNPHAGRSDHLLRSEAEEISLLYGDIDD